MSDDVKDPEHSSASLVGAPPYALPKDEGGEGAVVGHPEPPTALSDSPVRGDTDNLDAPFEAKGGAKKNLDPVPDDRITTEAENPPPRDDPDPAPRKRAAKTAKKSAARR